MLFLRSFEIKSLSCRHRRQLLGGVLGALSCFTMLHLIKKLRLLSFRTQMCLDSSVSVEYFLCAMDLQWLRYLVLKLLAVAPIITRNMGQDD